MSDFVIAFTILFIGFLISKVIEFLHFHSIRKREKKLLSFPVTSEQKTFCDKKITRGKLVCAEVSLATDYYKRFVALILSLFGLNIVVYEKLLDRARREAILRLKEKCKEYDAIINLKIDTVRIYSRLLGKKHSTICLQVLVSGTAINYI